MAIDSVIVTTTATVVTGDCRYLGASIRDATGDGNAIVYKGTSAVAANVVDVLAASDEVQADHSVPPKPGVRCPGGIHVVKTNCDNVVIWYEMGA